MAAASRAGAEAYDEWQLAAPQLPAVQAAHCWVYDPAVWKDGYLRRVVLVGGVIPCAPAGLQLTRAAGPPERSGDTVTLTAGATVLFPAQLLVASKGGTSKRERSGGAGLFAVTWARDVEVGALRPVVVVVEHLAAARSRRLRRLTVDDDWSAWQAGYTATISS